jgi:hypothetical protein
MGARNHEPGIMDIEKRNDGRVASKNERMEGMRPKVWNNAPIFDNEDRNNGRGSKGSTWGHWLFAAFW